MMVIPRLYRFNGFNIAKHVTDAGVASDNDRRSNRGK